MDFTSFVFGNVNEDGELEDEEILDKVDGALYIALELIMLSCLVQDCVAGLSRLGMGLGSVISEELAGANEEGDSELESEEDSNKADNAEDYADITEVSDDVMVIAHVSES